MFGKRKRRKLFPKNLKGTALSSRQKTVKKKRGALMQKYAFLNIYEPNKIKQENKYGDNHCWRSEAKRTDRKEEKDEGIWPLFKKPLITKERDAEIYFS